MKRTSAILAGLVLVLVIGGVTFALSRKSNTTDSTTNQTTNTVTDTSTTNSSDAAEAASVTITYDGNSFSPSKVTVKSGDSVTIKNTGSIKLDFASDPHPTHTDNGELNIGSVAAGGSQTFTPTSKGTWGYHNHLDPTQTGTIVVE
jgi:plastocyanin